MKRYEYIVDLRETTLPNEPIPEWLTCRPPTAADTGILADLMMDAFPGSIDFEGTETWQDAWRDIDSFFAGKHGQPLLDCSQLLFVGNDLASTCLVGMWDARQRPLIHTIMTAALWKEQGLARLSLQHAIQSLSRNGFTEVSAVITAGNMPSETLFTHIGFKRLPQRKAAHEF